MRLLPFPFLSTVSPSDLIAYECSDRIVVPKAMYDGYGQPNVILCLTNALRESVGGVLHGPHELDDSLLYVPSWMFYRFAVHDGITLTSLATVPCSHIQMTPPNDVFLNQDGSLAAFQRALMNYKTLTQNTRILVATEPPVFVSIGLLHPAAPLTLLVFNVGAVDLTLLPAKAIQSPYLYNAAKPPKHIPFAGVGHTCAPTVVVDATTVRQRMIDAAKNRMAESQTAQRITSTIQ